MTEPAATPSESWRLLPFDRGSSEVHFALSDALVRHGRLPTVWWHAAVEPTLILGPAQRGLSPRGSPRIVRRAAGGTAVLAAPGVLGLDVFLPAGHPLALADVVEAYRWLGEAWRDALEGLGVHAHLVTLAEARADRPPKTLADLLRQACFGTLSPYEVTVGGRKLVGLAQVRRSAGVLLQAGIHRHFDAAGLAAVLASGDAEFAAELSRRATGLDELLADVPNDPQLRTAFQSVVTRTHDVEFVPGTWSPAERAHAGLPD